MRSVTKSRTTPQPVSLDEAKDQLGYALSDTSSDDRISRLIAAATEQWEHDTQAQTTVADVNEKLPYFPTEFWRMYWRPVVSVTSIEYYDTDNALQTLDPSVYSLDLPNRKIYLAVDQSWPDVTERFDAVTINYQAGESIPTEISKQAILTQVDIMEELRGTTKDKDASVTLYENLVARYQRGSYP